MKKILLFLLANIIVTAVNARTAKDMLLCMPDSVMPYLTHDTRVVLTENPDSVITAGNGFGTFVVKGAKGAKETSLDDIVRLTVSDHINMEIGRLEPNRFVVITTYGGPEKESSCMVCDSLWQTITRLSFDNMDFFADSASVEQYKMVEFPLIEAHLADKPTTLILNLNAPFLSAEDKKALAPYLRQRKLNWDGNSFN